MTNFTEFELIPFSLKVILNVPNGIETKHLITELRKLMNPNGEDLEILSNRSDDKFSQKVRNLKSHKTLENKGLVEFYNNKFFITKEGLKYLDQISWEDLDKIYISIEEKKSENFITDFKFKKDKWGNQLIYDDCLKDNKVLNNDESDQALKDFDEDEMIQLEKIAKNIIVNSKETPTKEIISESEVNKNLFKKIDELDLSVRTLNCLKNENIIYVGDLIQLTENYLLKSNNFGKKSLDELKEILSSMSLYLGMELTNWSPDNINDEISLKSHKIINNNELDTKIPFSKLKINILKEWFLSVRTVNCLKALGIEFVGDLIQWTELDLLLSRNFGRKSLIELKKYLEKNSIYLGSFDLIDANVWDRERLILKNNINKNEFSKKSLELSVSSSLFINFVEFQNEQLSCNKIIIEKQLSKEELEKIIIKDIKKIVESLKERPREIFLSRYGYLQKYETLEELGKRFKITRERVRQIESKINDSIGSIGLVDRSSLLRYFNQYEFVSFHKLFPQLDKDFLSVSNNSNKDISGDRLSIFLENYCGLKSNFFKTPERELVNFDKDKLSKVFEITSSGITRENFEEIIKDNFGYNNFVCQSAITFMEKTNLIKIIDNNIYPLNLTRSEEVSNILLEYPNGLHWKKIIKIGNSSYTKNKWNENRMMSDHSLDMMVNKGIYLSDRGTHKSLKFCIEISRYEKILEKFIFELKKLNKVTEFMEKVYQLVIQDEYFKDLNFYDARAIIKIYGQEKGIFHSGRSGTNTIGLIKNISPINLKEKIKNIINEKDGEIHHQEILNELTKTNEDVPINQALEKLVNDFIIFRIDMGTYMKYEDAINLCNIVEIKDYLEELLSNYEFITSSFIREKINSNLGFSLSTFYYASLVKIIAKDNSWFCGHNYLSKKQEKSASIEQYIKNNYDNNLSINENFSNFSEKIGVSKTYFYNIVSINKLNFNTDWIHADD